MITHNHITLKKRQLFEAFFFAFFAMGMYGIPNSFCCTSAPEIETLPKKCHQLLSALSTQMTNVLLGYTYSAKQNLTAEKRGDIPVDNRCIHLFSRSFLSDLNDICTQPCMYRFQRDLLK